jgi:DNA-binding IclR family transcriptional regulator
MREVAEPSRRHSIPAIDRLMQVLGQLERHAEGLTITELTDALHLPRTTVYRLMNSLHRYQMVHRDEAGRYCLGSRLLTLANEVAARATDFDLAALAQPCLDRVAGEVGETVKLSVMDNQGVLVLAVAQGTREYALTVPAGQRVPPHVGAAGKLLLAHLPLARQQKLIRPPLAVYTSKTITDAGRLRNELARIRRVGWARDRGENAPSIHAFAAPVFGPDGTMIAALSMPFLAGTSSSRTEELRLATISAAKAISDLLAG